MPSLEDRLRAVEDQLAIADLRARYCHLLDPRSGQPVAHTQALTVLITPRPQAGTLSDMASKPLFIAGLSRRARTTA